MLRSIRYVYGQAKTTRDKESCVGVFVRFRAPLHRDRRFIIFLTARSEEYTVAFDGLMTILQKLLANFMMGHIYFGRKRKMKRLCGETIFYIVPADKKVTAAEFGNYSILLNGCGVYYANMQYRMCDIQD
jgi:hypothetical protein